MHDFFGNKYFVAIAFPLILLLCGAFVKKIGRSNGWKKSDFYLGNELLLSSIGAALLNVYDLTKAANKTDIPNSYVGDFWASAGFLVVSFFTLMVIVSFHQDWESRTSRSRWQFFWLGIFCNSIGIFFFAGFVIWVKGV